MKCLPFWKTPRQKHAKKVSPKQRQMEDDSYVKEIPALNSLREFRFRKQITFQSGMLKPKWSYFLRAESFYNVASEAAHNYNDDGCMTDFHARSHGESFLEFILENDEKGLYFMDEPEAVLSPQRQLTLLLHLVKMAEKGSQFIIVTHSPILLGTPDADIVSFDEGELHRISYEETESYQVTKLFLENREVMLWQLLQEETECETDAEI